jgi:Predicted Fe-S oxidoreductases
LELELTYSCNYACNYCYNPLNREFRSELNSDTWCNVIDEAIELGVEHLSFTGGAPLLRADKLFKCLEHLRAKDQRIATRLVANGSLISDELAEIKTARAGYCTVFFAFR